MKDIENRLDIHNYLHFLSSQSDQSNSTFCSSYYIERFFSFSVPLKSLNCPFLPALFLPFQAIALILGVVYLDQDVNQQGVMNINGALFLILTNMTFQNMFGVVNVFCVELPIFLREHFNGMYR